MPTRMMMVMMMMMMMKIFFVADNEVLSILVKFLKSLRYASSLMPSSKSGFQRIFKKSMEAHLHKNH